MKEDFASLLQKEMDRKDFLKHVGIGFAVITGAATMLKTLNGFSTSSQSKVSSSSAGYGHGYGASSYGGGGRAAQQVTASASYSS